MSRTPPRIVQYLLSTIGRKQTMGIAGIGLGLFVLTHAAGNMLVFIGPKAYNLYSHALISNPLIYLAEGGLVAIFVAHAIAGIVLTIKNWGARDKGYAVSPSGDKKTSLAMRTMWFQGLVILAFVVLHLITFKYGKHYDATYDGKLVRDLFRLVYEVFQSPVYVTWYIFALLMLCFHLAHGMYSSLQTLGLHHPKWTPLIKRGAIVYGVFIAGMFISQPLYMHFFFKG